MNKFKGSLLLAVLSLVFLTFQVHAQNTQQTPTPVPTPPNTSPTPHPTPTLPPTPTPHPTNTTSGDHTPTPTPQTQSTGSNSPSGSGESNQLPTNINPVIAQPTPGQVLTGQTKIQIYANAGSNIDVQIQPTTGTSGSVFLTRISSSTNSYQYSWDTTNTPNGAYQLYATIISSNQSQVIVGPVLINIINGQSSSGTSSGSKIVAPLQPSTSPLPPNASTPPGFKPSPNSSSNPSQSQSGITNIPVSSIKDITFPSEFDPKKIPAADSTVSIDKVDNATQNNQVVLSFHGKTLPNQIITVLIYSNPIVVTVKSDANGFWTYNLDKPLNPGQHVAYAVVPQADGTKVRSEVASFLIAPAEAASSNDESLTLGSAPENPAGNNLMIATVFIICCGILALIFIYKRRRINIVDESDSSKDNENT